MTQFSGLDIVELLLQAALSKAKVVGRLGESTSQWPARWNQKQKALSCFETGPRKECGPHVLFPEEEKIIVEETKSNGQTVIEEK